MNRPPCVSSAGRPPRGHCFFSAGTLYRGIGQLRRLSIALAILSLSAFSTIGWAIDITWSAANDLNGPFTFDVAPPLTDFTTASIGAGGTTYTTPEALNAAVQGLSVSAIPNALPTVAEATPGTNGLARWNSTLQSIQTRPTANGATILLGKFVNTTDRFITDFQILYDQANSNAVTNELLGHSLYYSTTGLANSWVPLGLTGEATPQPNYFANFVADGKPNWNQNLYLLWADDNGDGQTDTGYTIDNFLMQVAVGDPKTPPEPQFGTILPPASNTVGGGNLTLGTQLGGATVVNEGGNDILQLTGTASMLLVSDQVDLRGWNPATHNAVVGIDLRTRDDSAGSDFEIAEERINVSIEWSSDGLTFQTLPLLNLHGGTAPVAPATWPVPDDTLKPLDTGVNGAFTHFEFMVPAGAKTLRAVVDGNVAGSTTEFLFFDNLGVTLVPVPEPATLALLAFGAIGFVGVGVRRRTVKLFCK